MKNRKTAIILAILLGGVGAHRFYLGETGRGLLNLLFCWTFIPALGGAIIGILWLLSSNESFDRSFNSERIQREQMRIQKETLEAIKNK